MRTYIVRPPSATIITFLTYNFNKSTLYTNINATCYIRLRTLYPPAVEFVTRNHLHTFDPDQLINNPLFSLKLDEYLRQCGLFIK